ncbi:pepsin/retropepsin-like aspartic protease family protein [Pedobacter sp. JY14-1]|uniref:pepsin/retropepsin-like aspartic protease family protein n=1 Tax=Pedobacter sp. JY14-1 TaxID=3034151 RepID=UPI0023E27717|nr:pepsin/retropepsin-like aspartic protease family protein [Pedobacter sp. JY14-1]
MKPFLIRAILALGLLLPESNPLSAQTQLPVIRSGKPTVSIRDGRELSKDSWTLSPQARPDTYFVQVPRANRKVTFITDRDCISFTPQYGKTCDFVILKGKDSCFTRISANYQSNISPGRIQNTASQQADTLPFFMKDSRIYFKGKLNGSRELTIMFDFGAGITALNHTSAEIAKVKFDGTISVQNSSGTRNEPSSSSNQLQIAGLSWKNVPLVQVRNLDEGEDLIIGNSLLRDKIVEIDYEKQIMILSDTLQKDLAGYSAHDVIYYQDRPRFEVQVKVGKHYYPFHFLFDTGREGTMLVGDDFTNRYDLWNKFEKILSLGNKRIVRIEEVKIGGKSFRDIVTNVNNPKYPHPKQSLLGNQVLNQFNVVLDNHKGIIYLKPNALQNENYATFAEFKTQMIRIVASALVLLSGATYGIVRLVRYRRQRRKNRLNCALVN